MAARVVGRSIASESWQPDSSERASASFIVSASSFVASLASRLATRAANKVALVADNICFRSLGADGCSRPFMVHDDSRSQIKNKPTFAVRVVDFRAQYIA